MKSKIITVWGKANSGKTTLAVNLSLALASKNYMVGLISSKLLYGELQTFFNQYISSDKGIYRALFDINNVRNMFVPLEICDNLFILSTPNGMDSLILSHVSYEQTEAMINEALLYFDYIVIDGSEEVNNPISSIGLSIADIALIIYRPSVSTCLWHSGINTAFKLMQLKEKSINILYAYDGLCDLATFKNNIPITFDYEIPFSDVAALCQNEGLPIYINNSKHTKAFNKAIDGLVEIIIKGGGKNG